MLKGQVESLEKTFVDELKMKQNYSIWSMTQRFYMCIESKMKDKGVD